MDVTLLGIVMFLIPLPEKAPPSIVVTLLGSVRLVILEQPLNAVLLIIFNAEFKAMELFAGGQTRSFV
jgi:xanthosine utilization system XapX-like protein